MKITDEMVEAAWSAWMGVKKTPDDEYNEDDMRAAIAAALNAAPAETGIPATGKPLNITQVAEIIYSETLLYDPAEKRIKADGTPYGAWEAALNAGRLIMSAIEPAGVGVESPPPQTHLMGRHPDQTSPMTVGPEAFLEEDAGLLDQIERLVEAYVGGEYEAQGCAAEHILADVRELRQHPAASTRASVPATLKGDEQ